MRFLDSFWGEKKNGQEAPHEGRAQLHLRRGGEVLLQDAPVAEALQGVAGVASAVTLVLVVLLSAASWYADPETSLEFPSRA